ncbi:hypothetical protein [Embleya sp. NPDC001921]
MTELWVPVLTWADVDPLRHPFELDADVAKELAGRVEPLLPGADGLRPLDSVTEFLVDRYGRWACGWNWSVGDGNDTGGGVVRAWCCASHSVTTADATAPLVVAALLEWRDWLEDLAERFRALASPSNSVASSMDPRR